MEYIKLMRVRHYIKNVLVFIPLFFSKQLFNGEKFGMTLLGAVCFCLMSSAVYIVNDIRDVEKDRLHPVKKDRPIASGAVRIRTAWALAVVLIVVSVAVCRCVFSLQAALLLVLYLGLNLLYSFGLKDVALLDVCILVSGFLIRVLYGGCVADIKVSAWLFLTVVSVSLYFALGKRRNELKHHADSATRRVLAFYNKEFLDKNMYMCLGLTNGFYALWAREQINGAMVWTVPIVLILTMRYSLIVEGESEGDPVEVILKDKAILGLGLIYVICVFVMLYAGQ